jgi:Glucodextranase, domain B/Carboxypeptidase regulatory-like domain
MSMKKTLFVCLLLVALPAAAHVNVFGPKTFTASSGAPQTVSETLLLAGPCDLKPNAVYTLAVANDGVSSASIHVNGAEVVSESDFSQQVTSIERTVTLAASNTFTVTIKGGGNNAKLTLTIRRHVDLTESVFAEKTYTTTGKSDSFHDSFNVTGTTGSFSIIVRNGTPAVKSGSVRLNGVEVVSEQALNASTTVRKSVTLAAANQLVIDTKSDGAGAKVSVAVVRHVSDTTGPSITFDGLTDGQVVSASPLRVAGTVADISGVASFTVNGTPATLTGGAFAVDVPLVTGSNTIRFDAVDCEGNSVHRELAVVFEDKPALTIAAPQPGTISRTGTFAVSGTASSAAGIQSVIAAGVAMTLSGNSWSGTVTLTGDGSHDITVIATDTRGRQTTKSVAVVVDGSGPAITIVFPPREDMKHYIGTADVRGNVADISGVASVTCNGIAATLGEGSFMCTAFPLQAGVNTITILATDSVGNVATSTRHIERVVDTTPPAITAVIDSTPNAAGWFNTTVSVHFVCTDDLAIADCPDPLFAMRDFTGEVISGKARDAAGNTASASVTVNVDTTRPVFSLDGPEERFLNQPAVALSGTVSDATSGVAVVQCGSVNATIVGTGYSCSVPLNAGWQSINVIALDRAGNRSKKTVAVLRDVEPPQIQIIDPVGAVAATGRSLTIRGIVSDDDVIQLLTVGGATVQLDDEGVFQYTVTLMEGDNNIEVRARDRSGNVGIATVTARYLSRVAIDITSPADFAVLSSSVVTVTGQLSGPVASVTVNDIPAVVSGTTFTAAGVPLAQGRTVITAAATTTGGQVITDQLNLYRDSIPPRVAVYSPAVGSTVTSSPITVTGMVDDIVIGTINAGQVTVKVNGVNATVSNRAFQAGGIALTAGANTITIVATDHAGNAKTVTHAITYQAAPQLRLAIAAGDGQNAAIGATLPQALRVRLTNAAGVAVAGRDVTFSVVQNDGAVKAGGNPERTVVLATNASGEATVQWTLGHRAGAGNNVVRASVEGAAPVEFHAIAQSGPPALIVVDSGHGQFGVSNEALQRPLVAVAVDAGSNRLANVPVTFSVLSGGGSINGAQSAVVMTDSDGRAFVTPRLGPGSGSDNNAFAATVAGQPNAAIFRVTGRPAGPVAETRISGVVLDNSNIPIAGVTLRIDETTRSTVTNAQGQFAFTGAPVGYAKLIVDGTTAQRPGTWPTLEFVMYTNAGQDNTIGMPIYLLPIQVTSGIQVTETTGGMLTIPELPGFSLKVAPGSALFPNGSRAGTVSATLVHTDKVPMTPGFGQQPRFIVTIQPPGVHFDPPAAMTVPNLEGLAPGEITELYSFDHDLGQFVAIGTGSVSEDGTMVASDPGVGIIKGGWHCGGNPNPTGTSCNLTVTAVADYESDGPDPLLGATLQGPQAATQSKAAIAHDITATSVTVDSGGVVGTCVKIIANGQPLGGFLPIGTTTASFQIIEGGNVISPLGSTVCVNQPTCTVQYKGQQAGTAKVKVTYSGSIGSNPATTIVTVRFANFNPSIKELSFDGSGEIEIQQDDRVNPLFNDDKPVVDPVWTTTLPEAKPSAFPMNSTVRAKAVFTLVQPLPFTLQRVRVVGEAQVPGATPGTFTTAKFISEPSTIPSGTTTFTIENIKFNYPPATTLAMEPMSIRWRIAPLRNGGCPLVFDAGTTDVPFYYTLNEPFGSFVYRTVLKLAVKNVKASGENAVIDQVWRNFAFAGGGPTNVTTWQGLPLNYYNPAFGEAAHTHLRELLRRGNGQCYLFRDLMIEALHAHGIDARPILVQGRSAVPGGEQARMLVKRWSLGPSIAAPAGTVYGTEFYHLEWGGGDTAVGQLYGTCRNDFGEPGQNTSTPSAKIFKWHAFVAVGTGIGTTRYYDPSYGLEYSSPEDFQEKALDGWAFREPGSQNVFRVYKPGPETAPSFLNAEDTPSSNGN